MIAILSAVATLSILSLAVVFATAAVTKFANPTQTGDDFEQLGLPLARPLASIVPLFEMAIAVELILKPRLGAIAALVSLGAFSMILAGSLRRGKTVSCSCFGSLNRSPISALTLVRNAGLMVLAAIAASQTTLTRPGLAPLVTTSIALLILVVFGQLFVLRRQLGHIWSVELAGEANALSLEDN